MKQLNSDWVLASEPESGIQASRLSPAVAGFYAAAKMLSDESNLLLLTHQYMELRLNAHDALRAARADIMMGA
jgi:hypothetical protein